MPPPPPPPEEAPRVYPPWVSLIRRSAEGSASAPAGASVADIESWLLGEALGVDDLLPLIESLLWRLVAAGLPLDRASLHVGTLHPQLFGFAWNWNRADGFCDEVKVAEAAVRSDAYRRNPLFRVIEYGETLRADLQDPETVARYPLLAELVGQGMTEYVALPLHAGGTYHNAATAATRQRDGFTARQFTELSHLLKLFALHVERHIALRIAGNVMATYLGADAGGRVLHGSIKRGSGEPISAIVWISDLRGFTDLSDRLPGPAVIALLNAYFERLAGAVLAQGGQVLKFVGDGLLAVFPYAAFAEERAAAEAALAAARQALGALEALNADPPEDLAGLEGWRPLRTGIALHAGEVFFGNVGAPERLDFTVIGQAVNLASRVEALSKTLGRPLLITEEVAQRLSQPLDDLGVHPLRGLARPVRLYSPKG